VENVEKTNSATMYILPNTSSNLFFSSSFLQTFLFVFQMSKIPVSFSQITKIHDPIEVPPLWLDCPRKSTIIAGKYQ
jgi:hypothetical protein